MNVGLWRSSHFSTGTRIDPMVGQQDRAASMFGGGLGLYTTGHKIIGGVGVRAETLLAPTTTWPGGEEHFGLGPSARRTDKPAGAGTANFVAGDAHSSRQHYFRHRTKPRRLAPVIVSAVFGHPSCLNTSGSNTLPGSSAVTVVITIKQCFPFLDAFSCSGGIFLIITMTPSCTGASK